MDINSKTPAHVTVEIIWGPGYGRDRTETQTLDIGQVGPVELMHTMREFERAPGFVHWRKVAR